MNDIENLEEYLLKKAQESPEEHLLWLINKIEELAFSIRPENSYTPRFIQLTIEAKSILYKLKTKNQTKE